MNQTQQPAPAPKNGGSLKLLLIILAAVIVIGGGYLAYAKYFQTEEAPVASTSPTKITSASPTTTAKVSPTTSASIPADWKTYTNTTYGFSLTFNDKWIGYTVKENNPTGTSSTKTISFYVPTKDTTWPSQVNGAWSPFAITVYTIEQYNAAKNNLGPEDYIGKNNEYAFTYSTGQDDPSDGAAYTQDVHTVIQTFKAQ